MAAAVGVSLPQLLWLMDKSWGGVRHSDTVLITEDGFERMTKLDMGEIIIKSL